MGVHGEWLLDAETHLFVRLKSLKQMIRPPLKQSFGAFESSADCGEIEPKEKNKTGDVNVSSRDKPNYKVAQLTLKKSAAQNI